MVDRFPQARTRLLTMKFASFAGGAGSQSNGWTTRYAPGEWNAIDDITGFQAKSGELGHQWDGLMVRDVEERHPQDFLRSVPDHIETPWTRPDDYTFRTTAVTPDDL